MVYLRIKIADYIFEIDPHYEYSLKAAEGYHTDEKPDHYIDIDKEYIIKKHEENENSFSPAYTEWLEIYREISAYIEEHDGILMHGAVIGFEGAAYMFTAPSGTGKTTHISQWKKLYGDKVTVINGDKPIIRNIDGTFYVYGTPWCGKEHLNENTKAPLKGIAIVSRDAENSVERIDASKYLPVLFRQIYFHNTANCISNAMDFLDKMLTQVPLYSLKCNISTDAARVACEAMTKN